MLQIRACRSDICVVFFCALLHYYVLMQRIDVIRFIVSWRSVVTGNLAGILLFASFVVDISFFSNTCNMRLFDSTSEACHLVYVIHTCPLQERGLEFEFGLLISCKVDNLISIRIVWESKV